MQACVREISTRLRFVLCDEPLMLTQDVGVTGEVAALVQPDLYMRTVSSILAIFHSRSGLCHSNTSSSHLNDIQGLVSQSLPQSSTPPRSCKAPATAQAVFPASGGPAPSAASMKSGELKMRHPVQSDLPPVNTPALPAAALNPRLQPAHAHQEYPQAQQVRKAYICWQTAPCLRDIKFDMSFAAAWVLLHQGPCSLQISGNGAVLGTCLMKENVADTSCDSDNNGNIRYIVLPFFSCTRSLGGSL